MNLTRTLIAAAALAVLGPMEQPSAAIHLVEHLDELCKPLSAGTKVDLSIQAVMAMGALRQGDASWADCNVLAEVSNYAMLFCERGIEPEGLPVVHLAQDGLIRLKVRADKTGRYVADGPGLQALTALVDLYEKQLQAEACTPALWAWAMQECEKRIAFGNVVRTA